MTDTRSQPGVGFVVIGRNEGERLRLCLDSVADQSEVVVYVDSGSTDGSVEMARARGVEVVDLDLSVPFTAARARNEGVERLRAVAPHIELVHFVDGDCEVCPGWVAQAVETLLAGDRTAVVWGRRFERYPEKTFYNHLTDLEWRWSWPFGEVRICGGDALMRLKAFDEAGGFDSRLIAGEEPELCFRIREKGWKIIRIDAAMTKHDAAMTRFGQWWQRARRAGHAYAQGADLHGDSPERYCVKECRSMWFWGVLLPITAVAPAYWTYGASLMLLLGYPALAAKIFRYVHGQGAPAADGLLFAGSCVLAKFPGVLGQLNFVWNRLRGKPSLLIEYK